MITAANTGNRFDWPSFGPAEPMNAKSRTPARHAMQAHRMKAMKMYLRTGSRASAAAWRLPPMALSRKPKSERPSRKPKITSSAIIHTPCIGNLPGRWAFERFVKKSYSLLGTVWPVGGYCALKLCA